MDKLVAAGRITRVPVINDTHVQIEIYATGSRYAPGKEDWGSAGHESYNLTVTAVLPRTWLNDVKFNAKLKLTIEEVE